MMSKRDPNQAEDRRRECSDEVFLVLVVGVMTGQQSFHICLQRDEEEERMNLSRFIQSIQEFLVLNQKLFKMITPHIDRSQPV